jgi:signal transduction histidine kinase
LPLLRIITGVPDTSAGTLLRRWLRPPRHLLVLFLGTTLGFVAGLVWLGSTSIRQDRELDEQRARENLEDFTDTVAVEIRRGLSEIEMQIDRFSTLSDSVLPDAIAGYAARLPDDALVVTFDAGGVQASPRQRLLYYPSLPAADEPYFQTGVPGRAYALAESDPQSAVEVFEVLAADGSDPRVRAEALLGLARVQARLGRIEAALSTYAEVEDPDLFVGGRPAELLARIARCQLLADLSRPQVLSEELRRLSRDLHGGRWQLTRAAYQHYSAEIGRLAGPTMTLTDVAGPSASDLALAAGVDLLWRQWQDQNVPNSPVTGLLSRALGDHPVFLISRTTRERLVALVAGPAFLQDQVLGPLRGMLDRQSVHVVLADGEGRAVLSHGTAGPETRPAVRTMAETRLPWTLSVSGGGSALAVEGAAGREEREELVVAGLVFLALYVMAGSYFSVRAVTREIEAARLKSDFVAAVSHEFRTPLTLLRQFSDLLADNRVTSEQERHQYYAALQRGTRRLTRLVEDLLDFGRMEAGFHGFTLQPVAAREWLVALTDEFQEETRSRGVTVEVTWTGPSAVVQADEAAIGRALWNLMDNAVKYSPSCRTIWVSGRLEGDRLTVAVRDRGLGVSPGERRAIFRKFVRGAAGGGPPVRGTGLGLALVDQIVRGHGGRIVLTSVVGEGSTFAMVLPARAAGEPEEQQTWRAS